MKPIIGGENEILAEMCVVLSDISILDTQDREKRLCSLVVEGLRVRKVDRESLYRCSIEVLRRRAVGRG